MEWYIVVYILMRLASRHLEHRQLLNCSVAEDEVFLEDDNDKVKDKEVVEQEWGVTEQIGELLTATVNVMKDCQAVRHRLRCKRNTVYRTCCA